MSVLNKVISKIRRHVKKRHAENKDNYINLLKIIDTKEVTTYDVRLKGSNLDPSNPEGIEYKKIPRILTSEEIIKYTKKERTGEATNKGKILKAKSVQDYVRRKNSKFRK